MLLNLLLVYYSTNILDKKMFNQFTIVSFIGYFIMYFMFNNFILLIGLFDLLYFIFRYIDLVINNSNKTIVQHNNKPSFKKYTQPVHLKNALDPEFEKKNFIPYKCTLKDTMINLTQYGNS